MAITINGTTSTLSSSEQTIYTDKMVIGSNVSSSYMLAVYDENRFPMGLSTFSDIDGPTVRFRSFRGSFAAPLPIVSDHVLGGIRVFGGIDSANTISLLSGAIDIRASENFSVNNHGSHILFKTTTNGTTTAVERMRIENNGDVGIGTSTPTSELDVSSTAPVFTLTGTSSATDEKKWGLSSSSGDFWIYPINDTSTLSGYAYRIVRNGMNMTQHNWYAGSGVAEAAQLRMILDASTLEVLNDTSGYGVVPAEQTFRLASNVTAFGPAIGNFFGASSALSLEASSVYELTAYCVFLKTTAGTAAFTLTASSAPSRMFGTYIASNASGITSVLTPQTGAGGSQASTACAMTTSASLTTAVNHAFQIKAQIQTNAACNIRINLTQGAGTATPQAGSYYTVKKISTTSGTYVA